MACGLETRRSYGSWPDRHSWAVVAFKVPARIDALLSGRHPMAAMALGVPGTVLGLAVVAAYPIVFVPLLILIGAALVAAAHYEETSSYRRDPACWREDCPDTRGKAHGAAGRRAGQASLRRARST
jgi:hypothetical protein